MDRNPDVQLIEANHRAANSLAMVSALVRSAGRRSGEARSMSQKDVCILLDEIGLRIACIARLHAELAKHPLAETLDVVPHLREACHAVAEASCFGGELDLRETGTGPCPIPTNKIVPLAMILIEVLTAAVKASHTSDSPGRISVSWDRKPDGSFSLGVACDGPVPLDASAETPTVDNTGPWLIRSFSNQIGARATFESGGDGMHFTLALPMNGAKAPSRGSTVDRLARRE